MRDLALEQPELKPWPDYQSGIHRDEGGMARFWMKARAGWREKHEVVVLADPDEKQSDAELEAMLVET